MLQYSPKIVTDGLVMCLDPSQNKSYPTTDLPVKNGLGLWLDANDDSTFSYSSGTIVNQWRDKSGNNFHASQGTVASQPNRNTIQNSRKTINFDGSNDTVTIPNFSCNSEMSIFVVSNCGTSLFIEQSTDVNSFNGFYFSGVGTAMIAIRRGSALTYIFNNNWLSGGYSIASGVNSTGLDLLTYKNGTQQSLTSDNRASLTNSYTTATLYIGSRGANSLWTSGAIAEIIIYNRKVSDRERNLIHTYLGQKWGILNTDRSIIDLSGFNNNGLLGNGTTSDMPLFDFYNKGNLNFDGTNDAVIITNNFLPANSSFSISTWVKIKTVRSSALIDSMNDSAAYDGFALWITSGGKFIFYILKNTVTSITSTLSYSTDTWYNVVAIYNQSTIAIYINGVLDVSTSYSSGFDVGTANIGIGRRGANTNDPTSCNISQTSFYNRALSAAEVAQNYEAQKSKFANTIVQQGLVLNLDAGNPYSYAGAGTTWYDVSGNNNDLTIAGSPTYSLTQGWTFTNGSTANYMIKNPITFPTTTISVEVWCKTSGPGSTAIFSYASSVADNDFLIFDPSNVSLYTASGAVASGINITDGNWKQIVRTSNRSTGAEVLYVNGVSQFTTTLSAGTLVTTGGSLVLAQEQDSIGGGFDPNQAFGGNITIVRVYNRILTATEVLQNYNDTKGRFGL